MWFYSHSFDFDRIAVTYNGGNPALFWASVPAVVAAVLLAWRHPRGRFSRVAAAFAFQFLPWARVERATFQYHYLTAVLFDFIAIAYVLDEILRDRYLRDYGIAFLVAVGVTGLLIYPLNSALAMPDWYVNAARALPPWNYAFQFPAPPQGERPPASATTRSCSPSRPVCRWARSRSPRSQPRPAWGARRRLRRPLSRRGGGRRGGSAADDDEADGPKPPEVEPGHELLGEEPAADEDEDHAEDDVGPGPPRPRLTSTRSKRRRAVVRRVIQPARRPSPRPIIGPSGGITVRVRGRPRTPPRRRPRPRLPGSSGTTAHMTRYTIRECAAGEDRQRGHSTREMDEVDVEVGGGPRRHPPIFRSVTDRYRRRFTSGLRRDSGLNDAALPLNEISIWLSAEAKPACAEHRPPPGEPGFVKL